MAGGPGERWKGGAEHRPPGLAAVGAAQQSACQQGKQTIGVQLKAKQTICHEVDVVNEKGVKIAGQW